MSTQYETSCFYPQKIEQLFNLLIIWVSKTQKFEVFFDIVDGQQIECCFKNDERKCEITHVEHDSAYESADDSDDSFSEMRLYLKEDGEILYTNKYNQDLLINLKNFIYSSKIFSRTFEL